MFWFWVYFARVRFQQSSTSVTLASGSQFYTEIFIYSYIYVGLHSRIKQVLSIGLNSLNAFGCVAFLILSHLSYIDSCIMLLDINLTLLELAYHK